MVFRPGIKISTRHLAFLAAASLLFLLVYRFSVSKQPLPEYDLMLQAAKTMKRAEQIVYEHRQQCGLPVNAEKDPLNSGFIGREFSAITTTLGNIEAKQLSTNPDFAALYIRWFSRLNLTKGDTIIILSSGSFPALCISAIIAAETYGLEPLVFSSLGASSFGANLPQFTYWDMEHLLFKRGLIRHRTVFATPGGQNDNGSSFWEGGKKIAAQAAQRNGLRLFTPKNLDEAIAAKWALIRAVRSLRLFVNIGGNQTALGRFPCSMQIPPGLITRHLTCRSKPSGLIFRLNRAGLPVIQMLHIKDIALANGIALMPHKTENPGQSNLYYQKEGSLLLNLLSVLLLGGLWLLLWSKNRKDT